MDYIFFLAGRPDERPRAPWESGLRGVVAVTLRQDAAKVGPGLLQRRTRRIGAPSVGRAQAVEQQVLQPPALNRRTGQKLLVFAGLFC